MLSSILSFGLLATTLVSAVPVNTKPATIATYWGQGSDQASLRTFCDDSSIDIIPIGFVTGFANKHGGYPKTNFANACSSMYPGTDIHDKCTTIEADIKYCQSIGKKVLISLGGGVSDTSFNNDQEAATQGKQLWDIFGPPQCDYTGPRPFGQAVVDGFDFDIESGGSTGYAQLATTLRGLMNTDSQKSYYLSAAPQCIVNDAQLDGAIMTGLFDYLFVQFYNTAQCSAQAHFDHDFGAYGGPATDISFNAWANKIRNNNLKAKLFIGLTANPKAWDGSDDVYYQSLDKVTQLINDFGGDSTFGGVMVWEATSSKNNDDGSAKDRKEEGCGLPTKGQRPF